MTISLPVMKLSKPDTLLCCTECMHMMTSTCDICSYFKCENMTIVEVIKTDGYRSHHQNEKNECEAANTIIHFIDYFKTF